LEMAELSDGTIWAMTCYFNPVGYRRRLETYRLFRQRLTVPLATVELSFDGSFQLQPDDATVLLQVHGGDVMWQKERLLNVGLQMIPKTCDKIAWLDCDVVFTSDDWAAHASRALDELLLVHLFQERYDLPRNGTLEQLGSDAAQGAAPSMVYKILVEGVAPGELLVPHPGQKRLASNGLAWASRREVLEAHGLYDACILGSGDRAVLCAALGTFEYCTRALLMNRRQEEHYLAWAQPYFETVRGRIGYIPGRALHLWHGEVKDRQYGARDRGLEALDFDPFSDIALDRHGCWRWSSDKRELHAFVRHYFESRNEDGVDANARG
jgi:hypothetical protein